MYKIHQRNSVCDGQNLETICKMKKIQLYIDTTATKLTVKDRLFLIQNKKTQRQISPRRIDSIAITTNVQLNVAVIKLASKNDIPLFIYDSIGTPIAQLRSPYFMKHSRLRLMQMQFMHQKEGKKWAKNQLLLKTTEQCLSIARWQKTHTDKTEELNSIRTQIESYVPKIKMLPNHTPNINGSLMGYEGNISKLYFRAVNTVLPKQYQFEKRSRQPGKDYYNVSLNYIYGMTYNEIMKAIQSAGLDPYCGTLHKTRYGETLVFDMIEPFRPIVDRALIDLCMKEILVAKHFTPIANGYKINREGKKIMLPMYATYMYQRIKWQGKVTSVRNHMFLHARQLKEMIEETEYVFDFL